MIVMMTSSILPILSFVIIMDDKSNIWRNDEADLASVLFEFEDAISFSFFFKHILKEVPTEILTYYLLEWPSKSRIKNSIKPNN